MVKPEINLNEDQQSMLEGKQGVARQMAMRLLLDMAATSGAKELVPIHSAHLSGVSPLTGGLGLMVFLAKLAEDPLAQVAVPTTLNSAGCDANQFSKMLISVPGFLEQSQKIVELYSQIGVNPTQSCVPYEWDGVVTVGPAAWAESNAICFGNSYCGLVTNRESGLSALACALTGYTPKYGLLNPEARQPNMEVCVEHELVDPTDFSILGDWIGKQRQPSWPMPFGPIPFIRGLPSELSHEQSKALAAAAANYGSPLLFVEGISEDPGRSAIQATLHFTRTDLQQRYEELRPRAPISLITIGCPQASIGELRAVAKLLQDKKVSSDPEDGTGLPPLWIFTSSVSKAIAESTGLAKIITDSGALLLENTCPEVVPYDQRWVKHILTNSMKAEHYIKSGLNGIPTSVMRLEDCLAAATGQLHIQDRSHEMIAAQGNSRPARAGQAASVSKVRSKVHGEQFTANGRGLPSQGDFLVRGEAFVTDVPITLLGFVNRQTGVIEEPGHPADGQSMAGKIAIFPKGSGSTVAPYVLLELYYREMAPIAIINTEIDQQSAPASSLEGIPYAYDFDADIIQGINNGDQVELYRRGEIVSIRVLSQMDLKDRTPDTKGA